MNTYFNKTYIIFDRELRGYFRTPLASIFLLVFLALSSGMTFFLGRFFERDQADLIALGREALMNPNWPLHAMRELTEDKNFDSWPPNSGWWLEVRQRMLNSSDPNDWKVGLAAKNTPGAN